MKKTHVKSAYCLLSAFICGTVSVTAGCGEPAPGKQPLPLTKADLSLRMLENSRQGDHQAALSQCRKLRELGTPSMGFKILELNVNYNAVIDNAQKELDRGDAAKALEVLNGARSRFGSNQLFLAYIGRVEFLAGVQAHLAALRSAADLEGKRAALAVVEDDCSRDELLKELLASELAEVRTSIAEEEERIRKALETEAAEAAALTEKGTDAP